MDIIKCVMFIQNLSILDVIFYEVRKKKGIVVDISLVSEANSRGMLQIGTT